MPEISYRRFAPSDINSAHALSMAVKWPHRAQDWELFLKVGQGYVAEQDGQVVGTVLGWQYGPEVGSLGMVIVSPDMQGHGIGKKLMALILDDLKSGAVFLNATVAGQPLYEKLGFVKIGTLSQHQSASFTVPDIALPAKYAIRPLAKTDLPAMQALAASATQSDRGALFEALLDAGGGVALECAGELIGFALLREFGRGTVIGPVYAPVGNAAAQASSESLTQALIAALLRQLQGQFVRLDIHGDDALQAWLASVGLPSVDTPTSMVLRPLQNPDPSAQRARQVAIASQALG